MRQRFIFAAFIGVLTMMTAWAFAQYANAPVRDGAKTGTRAPVPNR